MFNPDNTELLRPPGAISIQDAERGRQDAVLRDFSTSHPELVARAVKLRVALRLANQAYNECEAEIADRAPPGGMRDVRESIERQADEALKTPQPAAPGQPETIVSPTGVPEGGKRVARRASTKSAPEAGGAEKLAADPNDLVPG